MPTGPSLMPYLKPVWRLALAASAGLPLSAPGATITWSTPTAETGLASDVVTTGTLLAAVTTSLLSPTIGSVTFTGAPVLQSDGKTIKFGSSVPISLTGSQFIYLTASYNLVPLTWLAAYQTLVDQGSAYGVTAQPSTLTIGGLTYGQAYLVQLWEPIWNYNWQTSYSDGTNVSSYLNTGGLGSYYFTGVLPGTPGGTVPQYITGTFIANGTTQTIYMTGATTYALFSGLQIRAIASPVDHVEIDLTSASGLTCSPSTLTVKACANAACSSLYTGGITGTLTSSNSNVVWASGASFTIGSGAGSVTLPLQLTVVGSATLSVSGLSVLTPNPVTCNFGASSATTTGCIYSSLAAGLIISMPSHYADVTPFTSGTVQAVQQSLTSNSCVPAFANVTRSVNISCSYQNPASSSGFVAVQDSSGNRKYLNQSNTNGNCDGIGLAVNLAFNASGNAALPLQEAQSGQFGLSFKYTGSLATNDLGLVLTGTTSYIAAPYALVLTPQTGTLVAGQNFSVGVSAVNGAGTTLTSWLNESTPQVPTLSFVKAKPTGAGSDAGGYTGTLNVINSGGGSGSSTNSNWNEVGYGDLTATISNYLGSGLVSTGTTGTSGAVGPFIPDHFDSVPTSSCGSFTYAAQPFALQLTARNAFGATTLNYDGGGTLSPAYAKNVTLSAATSIAAGSWSNNTPTASQFTLGVAQLNTAALMPSYTFSTKLTSPQTLQVRAIEKKPCW